VHVIANKAYDSDPLRFRLRHRGIELICPHKKNRVRPATQEGRGIFKGVDRSGAPYFPCSNVVLTAHPRQIGWSSRRQSSEVSTLLLFMLKELGGFSLMLSLMLFSAFRNPVRNVAIVDAFNVGLCVLAVTPLLSLSTLDIRRLYPGYVIWGRSLVRLAVAALLFYLRPREAIGGRY